MRGVSPGVASSGKRREIFTEATARSDRGALFAKLSGLPDAPVPKNAFEMGKLSWEEFLEKLKSQRNRSLPGPNGVPYLVYIRLENTRGLGKQYHDLYTQVASIQLNL